MSARDLAEVRADVFADADLPPMLKLFTLAVLHLLEVGEPNHRVKQLGPRESWAYRALRLCGYTGTRDELTPQLRHLIRDDVPKYRVDFSRPVPCVGTMLRPAGAPCAKRSTLSGSRINPLTGERTIIGACRNPRHEAEYDAITRAAWAAWRENGEPEPQPNSGGLLLRYFSSGIEDLYAWADRDYTKGAKVETAPELPAAGIVSLADRRRAKGTDQ